ncbi:LCP family protein [Lipingzhangella sp. LS1_29]|uniref:LCP family protein n=1 Tax=Lipingzhangella rawalii TaxID=2055835 RepID=A0ABU2H3E8_9ACTN|nr:LCP family protein [Lipingzhangella rawalii]MDS1269832.1 LCP family protein [Lipingzhangella rawalii]
MGDAQDDHNRPGVFRRPGSEAGSDDFERLYRPGESGRRSGSASGAGPPNRSSRERDSESRSRRPARRYATGDVRDGTGRKRQQRERRSRRRRIAVLTVLVVLLVIPGLFYLWADSRLHRVEALTDYEGRPDSQPGTTYMIVGDDSREGLSDEEQAELATGSDDGAELADTIMVLYVPSSGDPTLVSVPRDSLVTIPEHGDRKINAAYSFGGPSLLTRTFEESTGVRIDHYVEVGFAGFVDIVDAVGGVELCPDDAITDPKAALDIEAGCQEMDGGTALGYVRTRATPRGDLDRVERQREFFGALIETTTSPGVMFNPVRSVPLVLEGTDNFEVDESDRLRHLMSMGLAMRGGIETSAIPVASTPTLEGLGSVVMWDEQRSEQMFAAMRAGEPVPEEAMED